MSILVLGSFMMDQMVLTPRAPKKGETIIGKKFSVHPGGKGANQAVAAARLGSDVIMAGKVGEDNYGHVFVETLKNEGISTENIIVDPKHDTGVGLVTTEENGDNRIVVVPGANLAYNTEELQALDSVLDDVNILLMQLEMDITMIEQAVKKAKDKGLTVILNPAPAATLSDETLQSIDYLTPNETELEILSGLPVNNIEEVKEATKVLLNKGVSNVIVTLGDKGAWLQQCEEGKYIPGYQVNAVDTIAAGDSFNGALAYALEEKMDIEAAIKLANAVGALTVTKPGAIPSLPTYQAVKEFMEAQSNTDA